MKDIWKKFGIEEFPPAGCTTDLIVGEKVIYTNEYGISFEMEVIGFAKNDSFYGRYIHLIRAGTDGKGSAWWFPSHPDEVTAYSIGNDGGNKE